MKLTVICRNYILISLLILSVLCQSNSVYAEGAADNTEVSVTNEVLVKYMDLPQSIGNPRPLPKLEADIEDIAESVDLLTFSDEQEAQVALEKLEESPFIIAVEQNHPRSILQVNDPYYRSQWWLQDVKAEGLWPLKSKQQKSVTVAVIDSGIDQQHEELIGRVHTNGFNFITQNRNVQDDLGHGTQVSGIIAANTNNGIGISGMTGNFSVSILPLKTAGADGISTVAHNIQAIDYAIKNKADVINISQGGESSSAMEHDAILRAVQAGIPIVAAAGNEAARGNTVMYPAAYKEVISVGGVDQQNKRASFSNYNPSVDLVAPGKKIVTISPGNRYVIADGTSFATPIVAGAVAMMKAIRPDLTVQQTSDLLVSSTTDLGQPGKDEEYGAGLLDVSALQVQLERMQRLNEEVPVEEILLDRNHMELMLGSGSEVTRLTATILPANATNREVVWSTSNARVATVTQQGEVTAVGEGDAEIIVRTADNKHSASATVSISKEKTFVGSFPDLVVDHEKIFEVKFNQSLVSDQDYKLYIRISRKANGQEPITEFSARIHPTAPDKLLVSPTESWEPGVYYLTIQKGISAKGRITLKDDVQVKIIVQ